MPSSPFLYSRIAFAALACCASVAHAQEVTLPVTEVQARGDHPGQMNLDAPAASSSRLGLTIKETPASVYQIDRKTMQDRDVRTTQEALRNVPGINATDKPDIGGFLSYRGFSGTQITHLFNGISVQYDMVAGRPVSSWGYESVEVVGGPSSFLYGAGAVGGSINNITRLPERANKYEGLLRAGSHSTAQAAVGLNHILAGDAKKGHFLRLDANVQRVGSRIEGNTNKNQQINGSLLSDITPNLTHTLALEYQHEKIDRPYWGTPLLNPTTGTGRILEGTRYKNYNSIDGRYEQTVNWARSILEYRPSSNIGIKNTIYQYRAQRDYENVEGYLFTPDNKKVIRTEALLQRHKQTLTGNRLEATIKSSIGSMKSDWALGFDYSINKQTTYPYFPDFDEISIVDPYNFTAEKFYDIPTMTRDYKPNRTARVRTLALFAENRTRLSPSFSLLTGLRHDRIELDLTNHRTVNAANPASYVRRYAATTGRAGLMWDISPSANAYVQYSTAADPPSGSLTVTNFAQARSNTELTTGRQIELGSKVSLWDGRANATIAGYHIVRKNVATRDPSNPRNTILIGQQSARGVELGLDARITSQLSAQANIAYVDPKFDNFTEIVGGRPVSRAGRIPPNTPRSVANLWVNYAFKPGWNASMGVRRVSSMYGDNANTIKAPGYTLLDFGLDYKHSKNLAFRASLRNATNKVYASNVPPTPMFYLGEPRSFDLSMRFNF